MTFHALSDHFQPPVATVYHASHFFYFQSLATEVLTIVLLIRNRQVTGSIPVVGSRESITCSHLFGWLFFIVPKTVTFISRIRGISSNVQFGMLIPLRDCH